MRLNFRTQPKYSPNLRWGFFIALSIILLLPVRVFPNKTTSNISFLHGQTIDRDGQAIPYVSLIFQKSELFLLSDDNGQFSYNAPLTEDDSVLVQRIGYKRKFLSVREIFMTGMIKLTPDILTMESVEVEGHSLSHNTLSSLGHHAKTQGSAPMNHNNMLARIPGISIKSYGGPAGISTLSMDGGPSSNTLVLVNGIDISSAQNGEADLSQLPLPFIESMSYIPYDITRTGDGGIDGVVKLETGDQQTHLNLSQGSYGHTAYDLYIKKQIMGFWGSFQLGQFEEVGNYPVSWDGHEYARKNNDMKQAFAAISLRKMISPEIYWQMSAMSSRQSRGVAGLLWSPDTISHRNDQLTLLGSVLGWIRPGGSSHLKFASRMSQEQYTNPYLNVSSDHHLKAYHLSFEDNRQLGPRFDLDAEINFNLDEINSSNTANHQRRSINSSVAPSIRLFQNILVTPRFKIHYSPDLYEEFLEDFQLQIPLHMGPLSHLGFSLGDVFKYPSFNDQYWEPGGNPNLKPENTRVTTLQSLIDLKQFGDLRLQWQKKESHNLIQWMPVLSYWQPGNVSSASRESSKALWQIELPGRGLSAFAHYSRIHTRDHEKELPLRLAPEHTAALGLTWVQAQFEINTQYQYVSDRISMYGYPTHVIIDAAGLWSGSIAHTWTGKLGHFTLVISAENLEDVSYETIKGYPEPGRSYRISTKFSR